MAALAEVVRALAARDGIDAVVMISADGLPIDHAARAGCDADALAALAVTLTRSAHQLGRSAGRGELSRAVLEYDGGIAITSSLDGGNSILVLAASGADVGPILYDLRRHASVLGALL